MMGYWKTKKNNPQKDEGAICFLHFFSRLAICFLYFFSRLIASFVCAFLGSILIARIAGEKIMYNIPIRAGTFLVRVFSPDTVIDGETAYDVHMLDEFLFLFVPLFVCFFVLFKFKNNFNRVAGVSHILDYDVQLARCTSCHDNGRRLPSN